MNYRLIPDTNDGVLQMVLQNVVIAGASVAGVTAARELRAQGYTGHLTIIDRDPHSPYRRPEVSKGLVSGVLGLDKVSMPWPDDLDAERLVGVELTGLNLAERSVSISTAAGTRDIGFDGLIIATGTVSRPSPFGEGIPGVHSLRNYTDSIKMRDELVDARSLVVVGGGFIGLEVAAVARSLGKSVTVVEAAALPLERVFGEEFSLQLLKNHQLQGVDVRLGASVSSLERGESGAVSEVVLGDGSRIPADVVLVAIGSVPATTWLAGSGVDISQGVICDATCAVLDEKGAVIDGVVAAGDAVTWYNSLYQRQMRVEHWTNAIEQGAYAAKRLLGTHDPDGFVSAPYFWSDQYGSRIQSIGSTFGHDEAVVLDDDPDLLLVAYLHEGRLVAVAGMKAGASIFRYRALVNSGGSLDEVRAHAQALREAAEAKRQQVLERTA
ncbi:NAD(P)/FAD-dependent oxidoreductase [Subtercola endophyticus]|uniref:NAD(P)/FAD-dependent oxidoreductase n=1 Tax=Subtercola endophyticus TaxID=2895559 RepID=UPI001E2B19D1|nr:FAD-dependent oxidoreductase [Subtercola endophyticus]UFS58113.1 FAD-dependent oxidoreductase [Subtercola endophyticus]